MSRNLEQIQNIVELDEIFPFFAIELMFDQRSISFGGADVEVGPLYFWTGLGDITIGGITYTGAGQFLQISNVTETADLRAAGATVVMSGLPTDVISLALQEPYQGRIARIKFGMMNANKGNAEEEGGGLFTQEDTGNLDFSEGDPAVLIPLFIGYMDQMNISEGPDEATVTLSLENKLIDLEVTKTRRYTSEFAKQRDSGDKAFDYVNDLQNRTLNWGKE
jgi:hypothetical protein